MKQRAKQRGAATFETIVMMPAFATTLALSLLAYNVVDGKLGAMKAARGPVYTQALGACSAEDPASVATADPGMPAKLPDGVDLGGIARDVPGAAGAEVVDGAFGARTGNVVRTLVADGIVGGGSYQLGGHVQMMCNETIYAGDLPAMKRSAAGAFDPRSR